MLCGRALPTLSTLHVHFLLFLRCGICESPETEYSSYQAFKSYKVTQLGDGWYKCSDLFRSYGGCSHLTTYRNEHIFA